MRQAVEGWKRRVGQLRRETYALYFACRDPRVPWYAKFFVACVVGYAFSPIDLIPDPIPILGYLDDLVLIPLGIVLALKMIPPAVLAECREKAQALIDRGKPSSRVAASVVVLIWLGFAVLAVVLILRALSRSA